MQHLEGSGTPVLYIGRTVLKGYLCMSDSDVIFSQATSFLSILYMFQLYTYSHNQEVFNHKTQETDQHLLTCT